MAWGDADTLTAGAITAWGSASGTATCEASGWNGKKSVLFNGTSDVLALASGGVGSGDDVAFSVVASMQLVSAGAAKILWALSRSSSDTPYTRFRTSGGSAWQAIKHDDATGTQQAGTTASDTSRHIHSLVFDGSSLATWIDGSADIAPASFVAAGTTTLDRFCIGASKGATTTGYSNSRFRRWAVANAALSATDRALLEAWAAG